jgi:catechol 2,3-dioxygenase-like lactoylglutathione lyase family enzyme
VLRKLVLKARDRSHRCQGRRSRRPRGWAIVLVALAGGVAPARLTATEFRGVRLNVADPQSAADWYVKHLGGTLGPTAAPTDESEGDARRVCTVRFGKVTLEFAPIYISPPIWPVLGSVGSGVDHLGFAYPDLDREMKRFASEGVEIVSGVEREGPIRYAFIRDQWGTLIELVEDREIHGFHHVHLATTDARATLKWYSDLFGGPVAHYAGVLPGLRYGDVWVLVKTVKVAPAPTEGRSIGQLNWAFPGIGEFQRRAVGTRLPYTVKANEIKMAGPDRVQFSILAVNQSGH